MAKFVDNYCDISGMSSDPEKPCFYAHNGATCSIIRVYGTRSIVSPEEVAHNSATIFENLSSNLKDKGHGITVTFEQSNNTKEEIERVITPLRHSAEQKNLSMTAILKEMEALLQEQVVAERILIAVWTYPKAAIKERLKEDLQDRSSEFDDLDISHNIQDPSGPFQSLEAIHFSFVKLVESFLNRGGFVCELLGTNKDKMRDDLAEVRRSLLFHETPQNWKPIASGELRYPKAKKTKNTDVANLFAPTLAKQIMTASAVCSNDLRTIQLGGRKFAVAYFSAFPRRMEFFKKVLTAIRGTGINEKTMPFRIAFHMEGGARVNQLKLICSTLASIFAGKNKSIRQSLEGIQSLMFSDKENFANARITATTWVEPSEDEAILNERRSKLIRALVSWESPTVLDSSYDPLRLLCETAAGMTAVCRTDQPFIAPVKEIALSLPLHSEAPTEKSGETNFCTIDGKVLPYKAHSPLQVSWLTLIIALSGSGKSVLLNMMNLYFAAFYSGSELPFIGTIDIGVSSFGFIKQLQASLPVDQQHLVSFIKMRKDSGNLEYNVNPFDLGLGRREPLSYEKSFIQNFLMVMVGETNNEGYALVDYLIAQTYIRVSDISVRGTPKIWQKGASLEVDQACEKFGIKLHNEMTWWNIVDELVLKGQFATAEVAQRYAMPVLNDVINILSSTETKNKFSDEICKKAEVLLSSAINRFPCFTTETHLDIGRARVVAIDIDNVITKSPTNEQDKQSNVLFFLIARELFVKKVSGDLGEIAAMRFTDKPDVAKIYQKYWFEKLSNIQQTRKRFCFDEFHITGQSEIMHRQIEQDIRMGRKWGFEILLASQKIEDFSAYTEMASNIFIMNNNPSDYEKIKTIFGVSDAVLKQLKDHVKGPSEANIPAFLLGRKLDAGDTWLIARNKIGPTNQWALTTTMEDRVIRDTLYSRIGVDKALQILAARFPKGSARSYWNEVTSKSGKENIASLICDELIINQDTILK